MQFEVAEASCAKFTNLKNYTAMEINQEEEKKWLTFRNSRIAGTEMATLDFVC